MKRIAIWGLGLVGAVCALVAALFVATMGEYTVPALVTEDPTLPGLEIAGIRLHADIHEGPAGAHTIIVLHGGPGGDFRSLQALAALSDRYRVVFYDQRGAGLSARVPASALTIDGHLAELDALIDHVAQGEAVTLIGHSWGAMLAIAYLGRAPERIERAVLIEPGFLDAEGYTRWQERSREFMSGPSFLTAAVLTGFQSLHVDGPDPSARQDFLVGRMVANFADHPDNPYHCGQGFTAPSWRFGALSSSAMAGAPAAEVDRIGLGAERFTGPVLLVAGACDDWLGAPLQLQHAARFADARLAVIADAGHDVIWDNPNAALPVIRAFLAQ